MEFHREPGQVKHTMNHQWEDLQSSKGKTQDADAKIAALGFVSVKLATLNEPPIESFDEFADGLKLAKFIESLSAQRVKVSKRVKITGVRLDNLAVCEYAIKHLHESIGNKTTITAKEFFEVNDKAIVAWVTSLHRCFPEPPPPPPMAPPPEEDVEEEHETEEPEEAEAANAVPVMDQDHDGVPDFLPAMAQATPELVEVVDPNVSARSSMMDVAPPEPVNHARAMSHWHKAKAVGKVASGVNHMQLLASLRKPKTSIAAPDQAIPSMSDYTKGELYHSEPAAQADADPEAVTAPPASAPLATEGVVEDHGIGVDTHEELPEPVQMIMNMGFSQWAAKAALARYEGEVEHALNYILENPERAEEEGQALANSQGGEQQEPAPTVAKSTGPLPSVPSQWEIVYTAGVAYRHTPNFTDKSAVHGPDCGARLDVVRIARGETDGLIYLKPYSEDFDGWVPTTSPSGIIIAKEVKREAVSPWRAAKDPSTGKTYFFNSLTKQTSWTRPVDYNPPPPPPPKKKAADGSQTVTFQVPMSWRPGQYVTVNLPNGGTQLVAMAPNVKPGQQVKVSIPTKSSGAAPGGGKRPPPAAPKGDWIMTKDPASGRTYYLNTKTKQTSWTKPSGYNRPPPTIPSQNHSSAPHQTAGAPPGKAMVTFQVPAAWRPGQYINVRKPDGSMAQVAVAPGVKPGQTVRVAV